MKKTDAPILKYSAKGRSTRIEDFLLRPPVEKGADKIAAGVLADIKKDGDSAVVKYARQFDRSTVTLETICVSQTELAEAKKAVDAGFKKAAKEAHKRITEFAVAGLREDWRMPAPQGGWLGEKFVALDRVGAYIPGGAAPLASTALMTLTLAQVAGVPERVACTPANAEGKVNPYILYALDLAGATEIYKVGGIQAIGAMAYGTKTIRKVQKIVGPGGPYVTAAKRLVYGEVALDMVAGPSEVAIIADHTANADFVTCDLLAQTEHHGGIGYLITPSKKLVEIMKGRIDTGIIIQVKSVQEACEVANEIAAEHLEIMTEEPEKVQKSIRHAGAIFIGPYSPTVIGDYIAGPSHVLPTGGTARYFSPLSASTFIKSSQIIRYTKEALVASKEHVQKLTEMEGLYLHRISLEARLASPKTTPAVKTNPETGKGPAS